jgi:hypothetical protein
VIKQGDELSSIDWQSRFLFGSLDAIGLSPQGFSTFGF